MIHKKFYHSKFSQTKNDRTIFYYNANAVPKLLSIHYYLLSNKKALSFESAFFSLVLFISQTHCRLLRGF